MKISCESRNFIIFEDVEKIHLSVAQVEGKDQFVVACYGEAVGVVWSDDGTFQLKIYRFQVLLVHKPSRFAASSL